MGKRPDAYDDFFKSQNELSTRFTRAREVVLSDEGITMPQVFTLKALKENGGLCRMSDLAATRFHTPAAMTGIVDRLEEKQLVLRERDSRDRRVVRVRLTDKGSKVYRNTIPVFEKSISQFFSPLDKTKQKELAGLLRKLIRISSSA